MALRQERGTTRMVDLNDDFRLLIRKSCERGLKDCHALLGLPQLAPLLVVQPPSEQFKVLKRFLLDSIHHAIDGTDAKEERKAIKAAAACIGLEPWSGGPQEL